MECLIIWRKPEAHLLIPFSKQNFPLVILLEDIIDNAAWTSFNRVFAAAPRSHSFHHLHIGPCSVSLWIGLTENYYIQMASTLIMY